MPSSMSSSGLSSSGSSSGLSPMSGLQTPGLNILLASAVIGMSSPCRTRKMGLSSLGMVSTSPLRSSGGKGGAMGAGHDADVDAVAVADRDDDAIDAFETSGSNVLPAFGPARTRVFFRGPLSWGVDALLVVLANDCNPGLFRDRANRCSTAMQLAYGLDVRRMAVAAEARAVESLAAVGQAADMAVQLSCGNARLASGPAEAAAVEAPVASVPADPAALATAALVAVLGAVAAQAAAA